MLLFRRVKNWESRQNKMNGSYKWPPEVVKDEEEEVNLKLPQQMKRLPFPVKCTFGNDISFLQR